MHFAWELPVFRPFYRRHAGAVGIGLCGVWGTLAGIGLFDARHQRGDFIALGPLQGFRRPAHGHTRARGRGNGEVGGRFKEHDAWGEGLLVGHHEGKKLEKFGRELHQQFGHGRGISSGHWVQLSCPLR